MSALTRAVLISDNSTDYYGPGGRNPGMNGPYYQPQPPIPPQPGPPAGGTGGKGGGHFLLGLLAGVLITAMVGCGTYVGVRLYLMVRCTFVPSSPFTLDTISVSSSP